VGGLGVGQPLGTDHVPLVGHYPHAAQLSLAEVRVPGRVAAEQFGRPGRAEVAGEYRLRLVGGVRAEQLVQGRLAGAGLQQQRDAGRRPGGDRRQRRLR
jgi:hypothetical protein